MDLFFSIGKPFEIPGEGPPDIFVLISSSPPQIINGHPNCRVLSQAEIARN